MMEETLLLPQWAQSKQEQRAETLRKVGEGMQQFVTTMQTAFSAVGESLRCFFNDIAQSIKPVVDALQKALSHISTPQPLRRRKRSSRRRQVQEKRARLGLNTWGKLEEIKASRKWCYAYAQQKAR
jgi:hypothetical protein